MLKIPYLNVQTGAYVPPACKEQVLQVQVPVLTSYDIPQIIEVEEEEDWD